LSAWVNTFEIQELALENDVKKDIEAKFKAFKKWAKEQVELV